MLPRVLMLSLGLRRMNLIPTLHDDPSGTWKCRHVLWAIFSLAQTSSSLNCYSYMALNSFIFWSLFPEQSSLSLSSETQDFPFIFITFTSFVLALSVSLPPGVFGTLPTLIWHLQIWWTGHHCDVRVMDKHAKQDQACLLPLETFFQVISGLSVTVPSRFVWLAPSHLLTLHT